MALDFSRLAARPWRLAEAGGGAGGVGAASGGGGGGGRRGGRAAVRLVWRRVVVGGGVVSLAVALGGLGALVAGLAVLLALPAGRIAATRRLAAITVVRRLHRYPTSRIHGPAPPAGGSSAGV